MRSYKIIFMRLIGLVIVAMAAVEKAREAAGIEP